MEKDLIADTDDMGYKLFDALDLGVFESANGYYVSAIKGKMA